MQPRSAPPLSPSSRVAVSSFTPDLHSYVSVGLGIFSVPSGCLEFANDAFARLHGYESTEIYGISSDDLIPRAKQSDWDAQLAAGLQSGGAFTIEIERVRKDGSSFPALLRVTAINGESRILAEVHDRTAEEDIIAGLVGDRSLLMSCIQQFPIPVIVLDGCLERALVWSDAFLSLFPNPANLSQHVFETAVAAILDTLRCAAKTNSNTMTVHSSSSGLLGPVTLRPKPVIEASGQPLAVLALVDLISA